MDKKKISGKRILVLSVPSWNSKVGANTWQTLLEQYNPDNIAVISLREEYPDCKVSNHYFTISENRVIKSILRRKLKTGYVVERVEEMQESSEDLIEHNERYRKMSAKRSYFKLMVRELVWKLGRWKSTELENFIREFNPDVILYSMEGYIHFSRICRYAIKKAGAKAIGYFWDDNFTYKKEKGVGFKCFRFFQRKSLKKLVKKTDAFWAISEMTKIEADETFGIDCTVLTKPLRKLPVLSQSVHNPIKILYTGNLQIGRASSLVKIVQALKQVNLKNIYFELDVYTQTQLQESVMQNISCGFCHIHEAIVQDKVFELQNDADILLFLEDIDGKYARSARLSFSTKITDYLSTGKCIFAAGCLDTAPMQYLLTNNAAIVATTVSEMADCFNRIKENPDLLTEYAKNACECAIKNHNKEKILFTVNQTIEDLLNSQKQSQFEKRGLYENCAD